MPTTEEYLAVVVQLKAQADTQVADYTKVSEAHQLVLDRLNGIIETPAADYVALEKAKAGVETELANEKDGRRQDNETSAANNALLASQISAKDLQITDLQQTGLELQRANYDKDTVIADKQAEIETKEARILELENQLAALNPPGN